MILIETKEATDSIAPRCERRQSLALAQQERGAENLYRFCSMAAL